MTARGAPAAAVSRLGRHATQAKSRVEIDQRFSGVFDDPKFKRHTVVDKRGRASGARCAATAADAAALQCLRRLRNGAESAPMICDASTACPTRKPPEMRCALLLCRWHSIALSRRFPCTLQAAAKPDDEDDDASASDLSDEQGAAPALARDGARRGIRGSVSLSSSSSDEGALRVGWQLRCAVSDSHPAAARAWLVQTTTPKRRAVARRAFSRSLCPAKRTYRSSTRPIGSRSWTWSGNECAPSTFSRCVLLALCSH